MTLEKKYVEFLRGQGFHGDDEDLQTAGVVCHARASFFAGAAAMAEVQANRPADNQKLVDELAKWRDAYFAYLNRPIPPFTLGISPQPGDTKCES